MALSCSLLFEDLFDRGEPLLQLLASAELIHPRLLARRQELDVGAFDDRRELLRLALERLGRRHEAIERCRERLLRDRARTREQRRAIRAADDALDVGARQVALVRDL